MAEIVVSILLVFGSGFVLLGSLGLAKLPDIYARLHAPTKATTLGVGALLIASAVHHTALRGSLSAQELLIIIFFFLTAPIGAYLVSKAALHLRLKAGPAELPPKE